MAKRRTAEQWVRLVERWHRSGLSAAAFATQEGLRARTLSWWRWRLIREGKVAAAPVGTQPSKAERAVAKRRQASQSQPVTKGASKPPRRRSKAAKAAPSKRRVVKGQPAEPAARKRPVAEQKASAPAPVPLRLVEVVGTKVADEVAIEIVVGEVVVRARRGFDGETLRQVLSVLGEPGSPAC